MRLELAPFGVKVLSIVSGALKTMGQSHFDDWKLPENSLYAPAEATIRDKARGQEGAPRMAAEDYAKRVMSEIIKGRTGKFWYGASAGMVKFGTSWLPTWLMVCKASWLVWLPSRCHFASPRIKLTLQQDSGVQMKSGLDVIAKEHSIN